MAGIASARHHFAIDPEKDLPAVLRNRQKDDIRSELLRGKPDSAPAIAVGSFLHAAPPNVDGKDAPGSSSASGAAAEDKEGGAGGSKGSEIDSTLVKELFSHELHMLRLFKERLSRVEHLGHWDSDDSAKKCEILLPHPLSSPYSDRYLMLLLFARKFDLERTYDLLVQQTLWRRENLRDLDTHWPRFSGLSGFEALSAMEFMWSIPGARALNGSVVQYIEMSKFMPKNAVWSVTEYLQWSAWQWTKGAVGEGLDGMRSGITIVEDLKSVTMKNLGIGTPLTEKKVQKAMSSMQDAFPMRLDRIIILNPPGILKVLLKIARLFGIKKKLLERVVVLKKTSQLTDWIAPDQLAAKFGGEVDFDAAQYNKAVSNMGQAWEAAEDPALYPFPSANDDGECAAASGSKDEVRSPAVAIIDPAVDALGIVEPVRNTDAISSDDVSSSAVEEAAGANDEMSPVQLA